MNKTDGLTMYVTAKNLKSGDYFKSFDWNGDLMIGRRIGNRLYYFDAKSIHEEVNIETRVSEWDEEVFPLDFPTFIMMLAQQCIAENKPVASKINLEETVKGQYLQEGEFFIDPTDNSVGRRFKQVVVYLDQIYQDEDLNGVCDDEFVPVAFQQAILFLIQQQTQ